MRAVLWHCAHVLEARGWWTPEPPAAQDAAPEPAPALWPSDATWLQRLRCAYMLQPENFRCPYEGLTLNPLRLVAGAWQSVRALGGRASGRVLGCSLAVVGIA